jgi:tRNA pseudouridine38-40 synthase
MLPQRHIQLTIAYDGTDYHGWQIQPGYRTIQATISAAATSLLRSPIPVQGAARTDAGVHAWGQSALICTGHPIPLAELPLAMNNRLPRDITIRSAREVGPDFNLMASVVSKHYRYMIYAARIRPMRQSRFCWHIPSRLSIEPMQKAAQYVLGTQDFRSFASALERGQNTIRTISRCDVTVSEGDPDTIAIDVEGPGFLHHMIRILVGTLVDISHGHWMPEQIVDILASRDRQAAGHLAPACGLCLERIQFRGEPGCQSRDG